jgi:hypothetical protein
MAKLTFTTTEEALAALKEPTRRFRSRKVKSPRSTICCQGRAPMIRPLRG